MCKARDAAIYVTNRIVELKNSSKESPEDSSDPSPYSVDFFKVHKLLYYAQGIMLAIYDTPMFTEDIRLHTCGPYVGGMDGFYAMVDIDEVDRLLPEAVILSPNRRRVLDYVAKKYGCRDRNELIRSTIEETNRLAQIDNIETGKKQVLPTSVLKTHFEKQLSSEDIEKIKRG